METIQKITTLLGVFVLLSFSNLLAQSSIQGTWTSTYGDLRFHQINGQVFGDYAGRGIVEGTYKNKVLEGTFTWTDANGKPIEGKTGKLKFTFNGTSFKGRWGWKNLNSNWKGQRKSTSKPTLSKYKIGFSGIVMNKAKSRKLSNVKIAFSGQSRKATVSVTTGKNGAYSILLPRDKYKVLARAAGCQSFTMPGKGVNVLNQVKMQTYNIFMDCTSGNNNTNNSSGIDTKFDLKATRHKLIVLVHGITRGETADIDKGNTPDREYVNRMQHNQFYWGFHFMRTLLGQNSKSANLYHWVSRTTQKAITKRGWDKHTTRATSTALPKAKAAIFTAQKYSGQVTPRLGAMITYRDGSLTLREQTEATIDQIYDSYNHYFGRLPKSKQPMLYMVCHSFGGLVMRTIISNPTQKINGSALSKIHRNKADFIRNRIVWITTMATPHQGSAALPVQKDFANAIDKLARDMENELAGKATIELNVNGNKIGNKNNFVVKAVVGELKNAAHEVRTGYNDPSVKDIGRADAYNKTFLKPAYGIRTDESRIPIYTMTGRNSGSWYFLTPVRKKDPLGNSADEMKSHYSKYGANKIPGEATKAILGEIIAKSYFRPGKSFWGKPETPEGDRFSPFQYSNKGSKLNSFLVNGLFGKGLGIENKSDGIYDSDILVGWDSGHGLKLGTRTLNYFDHSKKWGGKYGSWYRLYSDEYGNSIYPWDFDNHRSYMYNEGIGAFIGNYLVKHAGAYAGTGKFSKWKNGKTHPPLKNKTVQICIKYIKDVNNDMDPGPDQADFVGYVQIGKYKSPKTKTAKGKNVLTPSKGNNCVWRWDLPVKGIIPIRIEIYDADSNAYGGDDEASISPRAFNHGLLFYLDVETGRVYGDITGTVRTSIAQPANYTVIGHTKSHRRVQVKFSIVLK